MAVDQVTEFSRPLWRDQADRWLNPANAAPPIAFSDHHPEDQDPDPPPAAPACPWPRVFPGL
jgi:hypothetical protein